jgi:hypothetical protein
MFEYLIYQLQEEGEGIIMLSTHHLAVMFISLDIDALMEGMSLIWLSD